MIKIYKLIDNTNGNVYVGSTKQKYLSSRLGTHRQDYKKAMNGKRHHLTSSQIIKNGDYKIQLIEETDDETRERYWILNTECVNKNIPGRTPKEWAEDNKERMTEYYKEYSSRRTAWYTSMGGSPFNNNLSLLKIDIDLFTF